MEILIILNLIIGLVVAGKVLIKPKTQQPAITASNPPEQLSLPAGHTLIRVWDNRTCERERQGWWFECSCGQIRASDSTNSKSFGSEERAVASYKSHAKLHVDIGPSVNVYKDLYEKEKARFAEYKKLCYCKDANDDIILFERGNTE